MFDIEAAEERRKIKDEVCEKTLPLDLDEKCRKCGLTYIIAKGHDCKPENLAANLQEAYELMKHQSEGFSRKMKNTFFKKYRSIIQKKYGVKLK